MNRQQLLSSFRMAVGFALWAMLTGLAILATLAIADGDVRENQRLERIHQDGMAAGAALCAKEPV